ncbi:hypothetical protein GCM10022409_32080 [Hymenobacter glaciei]|uniref:Uncharacterized protein n=1 Tax=Hymenobacter glaciei TaxID=877209 RepID=A0ABP7UHV2_9BACT
MEKPECDKRRTYFSKRNDVRIINVLSINNQSHNPTKLMERINDQFSLQKLAKKVKEIVVVDQTDPSTQSTEDVELSEEQLDIVSGGLDNGILILKP